MLKVYHIHDYVSIDGADWRKVGNGGYRVSDEEPQDALILDSISFDEARKYLSENLLDGVWNDSTMFRNKPTIRISYQYAWESVEYKNFNTISYKTEFKERKNVTLDWIMEHLPADQTIQYLKERGITTCPMNF